MIHRVSKENVNEAWPYLAPVLSRVIAKANGERTLEDMRRECEAGQTQLWFEGDSALVTEVIQYPRQKVARMIWCAGNMDDVKSGWKDVLEWAKAEGCQAVEMCGRRGWLKAMGFNEAYTVGRVEL